MNAKDNLKTAIKEIGDELKKELNETQAKEKYATMLSDAIANYVIQKLTELELI
jgi:ribosome-associated translation inhibitor RaiA